MEHGYFFFFKTFSITCYIISASFLFFFIFMKKIFLSGFFCFFLLGGGCVNTMAEKAIETQIESQTGGTVDVNIEDNAATYRDAQTGGMVSVGSGIALPDDFPKDFPVYNGNISIVSAASIPDQGVSLTFSSQDTSEEVATWYENTLTSEGWTRDQSYDLQGQVMRSYLKANERIAVSISQNTGATTGTVVRSSKE